MASVRARKDTGLLLIDFRYRGARCREQTLLPDTPANRNRLGKLAERIERAISRGEFAYADFFPDSPRAKSGSGDSPSAIAEPSPVSAVASDVRSDLPTFGEFAELWFTETEVRWRKHHRRTMRDTLDKIFLPTFGAKRLGEVSRADVLGFRAEIAKRRGRAGQALSAKRINKLMSQLKAILNEAADRHSIDSPMRGVKALKQKRSEVCPFTIEEVNLLIASVRADYRRYLTVRFLTGLRTGEANGLQWRDIDFVAGNIRVERTVSRTGDGDTKTEGSKRQIPMVPQVRAALEQQRAAALPDSEWVFHTPHGHPVDAVNFTNRVWYPLLRHLGLKPRPPYQMRHTAATLMLASGENPEWVAKVLGHSTTEMLFRVYSRFVPNLTRNDGRAFVGLLNARHGTDASAQATAPTGTERLIATLSPDDKRALLAALATELSQTGAQRAR
jgi:integrase